MEWRSTCPVAGGLDLLGDRWTLLVLRDLFRGQHKFSELAASPEKIPTNILTERLHRLVAQGLATTELYQERPPRFAYYLTPKGAELFPVLRELGTWFNRHHSHAVPMVRSVKPEIRVPKKKTVG